MLNEASRERDDRGRAHVAVKLFPRCVEAVPRNDHVVGQRLDVQRSSRDEGRFTGGRHGVFEERLKRVMPLRELGVQVRGASGYG